MTKNERALEVLRKEPWAQSLVRTIEAAGGLRKAPQGFLAELRFAYEMRLACPAAAIRYEFDAGVGGSTIDFYLPHGQMRWLIELVTLDDSRTITEMRASSRQQLAPGLTVESIDLASDAADPRRTPFAELIAGLKKIEDKVWDRNTGTPRKFPPPSVGWGHVLVVNMAGFEGSGDPDGAHLHELVLGSQRVAPEWRSDPDKGVVGLSIQPIRARARSPYSERST